MRTVPSTPRVIAYTSGADPCGIADYHGRLAEHLPELERSVRLPTRIVLRDRPLALVKQRLAYRALAAEADGYDVVLLQMISSWNGFRLGEYLLPTFLDRLRPPVVAVLHEWPESVPQEIAGRGLTGLARQALTRTLRRIDFAGDHFDQWLTRRFLPRLRHVIVHAEHLRERLLAAGVSSERITFSLMPVYPCPPPIGDTPALVPGDRRIVVLFGFPHPRKRYEVAIQALERLPTDTVMVLIGSASDNFRRTYLDELRALAASNGTLERLVITGEVDAGVLGGLLSRADVALAPAGYATGSASIGYLIAAGVPIVASDVPSVTALEDAGAGIVTFEGGNVSACVAALQHVLGGPAYREGLRRRNQQFAERHTFSRLGRRIDEALRAAGQVGGSTLTPLASAGARS
jgi:glycosyltransferase involved in cell wall biosynthesis